MINSSTVNPQEVTKFAQHSKDWWDLNGPLRTLHHINPARLEFINQHVALNKAHVLDVGCGGGVLTESMAKLGAIVTGIDAEPSAISEAQHHALKSNLNINYQATPIEEFPDQRFDVITCMELLEHIENPQVLLAHCKRLLNPQGLLFLSTINRTLKAYLGAIVAAEYVLNLLPKQTHDYHKFLKPSEIITITRALDFSLLEMKGIRYNPLLKTADLTSDLSINYLLVLKAS